MEVKPNICVDRSVMNYWEVWKERKIVEFFHLTYINDQLWEISFNVTILLETIFFICSFTFTSFFIYKNFSKKIKKQQKEVAPTEVISIETRQWVVTFTDYKRHNCLGAWP